MTYFDSVEISLPRDTWRLVIHAADCGVTDLDDTEDQKTVFNALFAIEREVGDG
jgi:hypothetical protein